MTDESEAQRHTLDHAWRYFELHASQRMSLFNFFLVFSGLVAAGTGGAFVRLPQVSTVAGVALAGVAFLFFKLDQRVSFLIKRAEAALVEAESPVPEYARLFATEPSETKHAERTESLWTYGKSFRTLYGVVGVLGLIVGGVSLLRWFVCGPAE